MKMVDMSNWKEFRIGDLFSSEQNGELKSVQQLSEGNIAVISSSMQEQGIIGYYTTNEPYENQLTIAHIGAGAGFCSYHNYKFNVTCNAGVLTCKHELNEYTGNFLASVITRHCMQRYDYKNVVTEGKLFAEIIKLPSTSDGKPDWQYMEDYMRKILEESEESLENLRKADNRKHLIDVNGWGEFMVGDLFDKLTLKCLKKDFNKAIDCSEEQTDEFSLPLTNAKHFNNGIQFYGRPDDWESAEMTIDIVSNGAIATGDVYAQPQRTGVLWDSYLVKCKYDITSELVLQYMSCVIQRCVKQYFGWNDKCTWDKVKEQMICLPITSTGEPDWQYMEEYMRKIMEEIDVRMKNYSKGQMKVGGNK